MPARNVSLTQHLAEFLDRNVETGRFSNASEVVREGLRLLEQRQAEDAACKCGWRRVPRMTPGTSNSFVGSSTRLQRQRRQRR